MTKPFLCLSIISFITTYAFAQPQSGIKLGVNQTIIPKNETYSFQPQIGSSISYQQVFKFTDKWHLALGLGYQMNSFIISYNDNLNADEKMSEESLIVPLTINYTYNKTSVKLGYQYQYISDVDLFGKGGLPSPDFHVNSVTTGIAYNFGFIDCSIDYIYTPKREMYYTSVYAEPVVQGGYVTEPIVTSSMSTIQLSVTIPLGKKRK
ncbi:hypothetical protein [Saccharicrinis aurantiacus]|uniref:hypothetical protein n=1 Tax=Saccharicrinis aurantiacus TaxID=1849719 RepID=UPI000838511D|nr:hypothetical protein [Saccharicrinis aurantiacus]